MQGHQALLILVGGVAPAESHLIIFKGGEAVTGDGDSMRVTAEITEGMLSAAKGPLAMTIHFLRKVCRRSCAKTLARPSGFKEPWNPSSSRANVSFNASVNLPRKTSANTSTGRKNFC